MNIGVITACCFENENPIHFLKRSCVRYGVELYPYGVGTTYTDWPDIKINKMLDHFKSMKTRGFTHVLYTDGRDSFFLTLFSEIFFKYNYLGAPQCLMAAETNCYPRRELAYEFPDPGHHYRWLGSGQFMGELDYLIDAWEMLKHDYAHVEGEDQNEQGWMLDAFVKGKFGPGFQLDTGCIIFQSAGNGDTAIQLSSDDPTAELQVRNGRVFNALTGSFPCAIHLNGGFSDPVTGKEPVIRPVWDAIGGWE